MRYYLDTNLLIFLLSNQTDEIDATVWSIFNDYSSLIHVSNIAVQELLFLYRIKKFRSRYFRREQDLIDALKESGIRIIYFNEYHLETYMSLHIITGHKDINDHAIIAQAISDRIPLISSDHEFRSYVPQGLDLLFNRR